MGRNRMHPRFDRDQLTRRDPRFRGNGQGQNRSQEARRPTYASDEERGGNGRRQPVIERVAARAQASPGQEQIEKTRFDATGAIFQTLAPEDRRHRVVLEVQDRLRQEPDLVTKRNVGDAIRQTHAALSRARREDVVEDGLRGVSGEVRRIFAEARHLGRRGSVLAPYERK